MMQIRIYLAPWLGKKYSYLSGPNIIRYFGFLDKDRSGPVGLLRRFSFGLIMFYLFILVYTFYGRIFDYEKLKDPIYGIM